MIKPQTSFLPFGVLLLSNQDAKNNVNITSSVNTESSGLTVTASGTIGDAVNSVASSLNQANDAGSRGNDRLEAAYNTKSALTAAQAGQSLYQDFTDESQANKDKQGNAIGVSASLGSSSSESKSNSQQNLVNGSNIAAGNNLTVIATGDGTRGADGFAANGDVTVIGSNLSGKDVYVGAARDVSFESAANTSTETSSNKSSSASVGLDVGVSASGKMGVSVSANVAVGKGNSSGSGTTHTETQVTATDHLTVNAGRDLSLTGAQARGDSIGVIPF